MWLIKILLDYEDWPTIIDLFSMCVVLRWFFIYILSAVFVVAVVRGIDNILNEFQLLCNSITRLLMGIYIYCDGLGHENNLFVRDSISYIST